MSATRGTVYRRKGRGQGSSPYWWIAFELNGRRYAKSTGIPVGPHNAGRREAREMLDALRGDTKRGITPNSEKVSLADLERLVLGNLEANGRASRDRAELAYKHLKTHLAAMPALQIPPLMDEYIAKRLAEKIGPPPEKGEPDLRRTTARATVRQELRWLGRGYRLASEKGLLPYRPALPSIAVQNARQGFVTEEQLEKLVAKLPGYLKAPTRFAFLTAWRKSEIFGLRWSSVDLENGVARVEASESKTRRAREFPFRAMPDLEALVLTQREATSAWERAHATICPWVFHRDGKRIGKGFYAAWNKAAASAGLEILLHDMRRSAIRQMELAGVPRSTAMRLSGHLTESTYTRYAISSQSDMEAGVAKIAALRASRAKRTG
jgi:integrase